MKKLILLIAFITAVPIGLVWATNTNLYEKEEPKIQSFTAKVKLVRESQDGIEVSFDSEAATGYYSLSHSQIKRADYSKFHELLTNRKIPLVKITAEKDDKIITSVTAVEKDEKLSKEASREAYKKEVDAEIDKALKGN